MKELLGDFIVRMVPIAIPIILVWSFLINHDMAPSGDSKSKKKGDSSDSPTEVEGSKDSKGADKPRES